MVNYLLKYRLITTFVTKILFHKRCDYTNFRITKIKDKIYKKKKNPPNLDIVRFRRCKIQTMYSGDKLESKKLKQSQNENDVILTFREKIRQILCKFPLITTS